MKINGANSVTWDVGESLLYAINSLEFTTSNEVVVDADGEKNIPARISSALSVTGSGINAKLTNKGAAVEAAALIVDAGSNLTISNNMTGGTFEVGRTTEGTVIVSNNQGAAAVNLGGLEDADITVTGSFTAKGVLGTTTIKGGGATADKAVINVIGSSSQTSATNLTIGGTTPTDKIDVTTAKGAVISGDNAGYATTITVKNDSSLNAENSTLVGKVTVKNENSAGKDNLFTLGQIGHTNWVTTLKVEANSGGAGVKVGDIVGASGITVDDNAKLTQVDGKTINSGTYTIKVTVGSNNASAALGDITGGKVTLTNNSSPADPAALTAGVVSGGATVTAYYASLAGLDSGNLIVDGEALISNDGKPAVIKGNSNIDGKNTAVSGGSTNDELALLDTVIGATDGPTNLTIGAAQGLEITAMPSGGPGSGTSTIVGGATEENKTSIIVGDKTGVNNIFNVLNFGMTNITEGYVEIANYDGGQIYLGDVTGGKVTLQNNITKNSLGGTNDADLVQDFTIGSITGNAEVTARYVGIRALDGGTIIADTYVEVADVTGSGNVIKGNDDATQDNALIKNDLGSTTQTEATELTVGAAEDKGGVTVGLENGLYGGADAATGTTVTVFNGSNFEQDTGLSVKGYITAVNHTTGQSGPGGNALALVLDTLDGATINGSGDITFRGTSGNGERNVLAGDGKGGESQFFVGEQLKGDYLEVRDTALVLTDNGKILGGPNGENGIFALRELTLNSSYGGDSILDSSLIDSFELVKQPDNIVIGDNDVVIRGNEIDVQNNFLLSDSNFTGSGKMVFAALDADEFINFNQGLDIKATTQGGAQFIGNTFIDAASNYDLQAADGVYFTGLTTANGAQALSTIEIAGRKLDTGDSTVHLDNTLKFDFTKDSSANDLDTGFGKIASLVTGDLGKTTIDFADGFDYLEADQLTVNGLTTFNSNLTLGQTPSAADRADRSGFYLSGGADGLLHLNEQATVNGVLTMGAGLSSETNPAVIVDATALDGKTALVLGNDSAGSTVAAGTYFSLAKDADGNLTNGIFQLVGLGAGATNGVSEAELAAMRENFEYTGTAYHGITTDAGYYDKDTGLFTSLNGQGTGSAINNTPSYGKGYVNALLWGNHIALADYFGNGLFGDGSKLVEGVTPNRGQGHKELVMAMGNTLSAVHMLATSGMNNIMAAFNSVHPTADHRIANSAGESENWGLWLTPSFSYTSVDDDYSQGYGGFDVKTAGVTMGLDYQFTDSFRAGLFAGYTGGELDGDYQDIDSDDMQVGLYAQATLPAGFTLNLGAAYGWQSFDADRDVRLGLTDYNQKIKSSFDGNTVSAALELNKIFNFEGDWHLRPGIGYTYVGTELDAYREKSSAAAKYSLAQEVEETDFDLHLFKVGTDIGWTSETASVVGRLYYVGNAGDTDVDTKASFRAAPNAPFTIKGAEYDRSMANLGVSLKVAPSDGASVVLDYDALLGSKSQSHNVNLTFRYEF
ncbi:hypothetical protein C4J81_18990 (plasmid) [Deltaproteobacteria bacterium Smac51]|nr:hypothetical protein C4J81_18990 [Deltaproteobacteria bacterium Smac51]